MEKMTLDELRASRSGTAYVDEVTVDGAQTHLVVVYPGARVEVAVPELPDTAHYRRPSAFRTVLAVQIRNSGDVLECSVLGSSPDGGPIRAAITLAQALKAASTGIRTVLISG